MVYHWYKSSQLESEEEITPKEGFCDKCGVYLLTSGDSEYCMLKDEIWAQTGLGNTLACVGCIEEALGRKLHHYDFQQIALNFHEDMQRFKGDRLKDRLQRLPDE